MYKNIKSENNMSMLLISHDLDLIKNYADKVIILKNGILIEMKYVKYHDLPSKQILDVVKPINSKVLAQVRLKKQSTQK